MEGERLARLVAWTSREGCRDTRHLQRHGRRAMTSFSQGQFLLGFLLVICLSFCCLFFPPACLFYLHPSSFPCLLFLPPFLSSLLCKCIIIILDMKINALVQIEQIDKFNKAQVAVTKVTVHTVPFSAFFLVYFS